MTNVNGQQTVQTSYGNGGGECGATLHRISTGQAHDVSRHWAHATWLVKGAHCRQKRAPRIIQDL